MIKGFDTNHGFPLFEHGFLLFKHALLNKKTHLFFGLRNTVVMICIVSFGLNIFLFTIPLRKHSMSFAQF